MSKKWITVGVFALIFVVALCVHNRISRQVDAKCAASPGEVISASAEFQTGLAALIAAVGGIGAISAAVHKWTDSLPDGQAKQLALAAVGLAEMPLYARIYNLEPDPTVKAKIRETARAANDAKFDREFPVGVVAKT